MNRNHFIRKAQTEALKKFDSNYSAILKRAASGELDLLQLKNLINFDDQYESERELVKERATIKAEREWERLEMEPEWELEMELETFNLYGG